MAQLKRANVEKLKLEHTLFFLSICSSFSSKTSPPKDGLEPLNFLVAVQTLSKHNLVPSSPGSVNHRIISEQRGRKSVKVFNGREGMEEEEWREMLNSSVEGKKSTSHATDHLSNHQKVRERIMTKSSVSLQTASNSGRHYDLATARNINGTKSVKTTVVSHLFQRISF